MDRTREKNLPAYHILDFPSQSRIFEYHCCSIGFAFVDNFSPNTRVTTVVGYGGPGSLSRGCYIIPHYNILLRIVLILYVMIMMVS